jgi:hypothetical protein
MKKLMILLLLAGACGCGGKKDDPNKRGAGRPIREEDLKAGVGKRPPVAKPVTTTVLTLPKLGLQLEVPSDAKAEEGAGKADVMSDSIASCWVMLRKADDMTEGYDKTLAALTEGKPGYPKVTTWGKNDKRPDGTYVMEYVGQTTVGTGSTLYGVSALVDVGGGEKWECGRNANDTAGQTCVAHACATLKKLPTP